MNINSRLNKLECQLNVAAINKNPCVCVPRNVRVFVDGVPLEHEWINKNGLCKRCKKEVEQIEVVYVRLDNEPITQAAIKNIQDNMSELLETGILLPRVDS